MNRDSSDGNVYIERDDMIDDLIIGADRRKADQLRAQASKDRIWRLRMRSLVNSTAMISGLAGLLARKLQDNEDLRTAAIWIGEQAENIEATLLAIAREEAGDD